MRGTDVASGWSLFSFLSAEQVCLLFPERTTAFPLVFSGKAKHAAETSSIETGREACAEASFRARAHAGPGAVGRRHQGAGPPNKAARRRSKEGSREVARQEEAKEEEAQAPFSLVIVVVVRRPSRPHRRPSESSESSSSSGSSSSSSSPSPRRRKKKSSRARSAPAAAPRKWRSSAFEHQYRANSAVADRLRRAKKQVKRGRRKKAVEQMEKGENLLESRQEWLAIADSHGVEVANAFEEGGELLGIVSSSQKSKRLSAAVQSVKAVGQRFRRGTPSRMGGGGGASNKPSSVPSQHYSQFSPQFPVANTPQFPPVSQSIQSPTLQGNKPIRTCFRCGEPGHYVSVCSKPAANITPRPGPAN